MPVSARYWPIPIADPIIGATLILYYSVMTNEVPHTNTEYLVLYTNVGVSLLP